MICPSANPLRKAMSTRPTTARQLQKWLHGGDFWGASQLQNNKPRVARRHLSATKMAPRNGLRNGAWGSSMTRKQKKSLDLFYSCPITSTTSRSVCAMLQQERPRLRSPLLSLQDQGRPVPDRLRDAAGQFRLWRRRSARGTAR